MNMAFIEVLYVATRAMHMLVERAAGQEWSGRCPGFLETLWGDRVLSRAAAHSLSMKGC